MKGSLLTKKQKSDLLKFFFKNNRKNLFLVIVLNSGNYIGQLGIAIILQKFTDIIFQGDIVELKKILLSFLLICIISGILYFLKTVVTAKFIKKGMLQYKEEIYQRIMQKNISAFYREKPSEYLSLFSNDMNVIETNYLRGIITIISLIISFISGSIGMIMYNAGVFFLILFLSSFSLVLSSFLGKKLAVIEKEVSNQNSKFILTLQDILKGFFVIKGYQIEGRMNSIFGQKNDSLENIKRKRFVTNGLIDTLLSFCSDIINFVVFAVCGYLAIKGKLTGGTVIAFIQLLNNITVPIRLIGSYIANKKSAKTLILKMEQHLSNFIEESSSQRKAITAKNDFKTANQADIRNPLRYFLITSCC